MNSIWTLAKSLPPYTKKTTTKSSEMAPEIDVTEIQTLYSLVKVLIYPQGEIEAKHT